MRRYLQKRNHFQRDFKDRHTAHLKRSDSELWLSLYAPYLHIWPFQDLCQKLETSSSMGLTSEVAARRLARYGKNKLKFPHSESKLLKYIRNCFHGFSIIILLSSILCFMTYYVETLYYQDQKAEREYLVAGMLLLVCLFMSGTYRYLQANNDFDVFAAFKDLMPMYCTVIRDGHKRIILTEDVVIGDVLVISFGQRLSADVRFFSAHGLEVNNVALMGLSKPEIIDPVASPNYINWSNVGFACSHVMKGYGLGLAIACGNETEVGQMARLSMEQRPQSRVRKHMNQITYCTAVVGILLFFIFICTISTPDLTYKHSFRFNLGLMIAMIPLFLPTVTYFGMVHIANRMLKSNCHIRNLESTSTLGLTTVICSDMIGTLTMNSMRVSEIFVDADLYRASDVDRDNIGARFLELIRVSVLCNDAVISPGTEGVPKLKKSLYGSADDIAFLKFALPIIDDIDQLRRDHELIANKCYNVFDQIHLTVHKTHNEEGAIKYILLMKGRYRAVLNYCSTYAVNDEEILLDDDLFYSIDDVAFQLTQAGRRVCAFAYKELDSELEYQRVSSYSGTDTYETTNTQVFKDYLKIDIFSLRFIGLIAAHDPPRAQLSTAVGDCRSAGIKLVLFTRQNAVVAQDIARYVGIIGPDSETLEDVAQRFNIDKSQVKRSLVTAAVINMRDYVQEKMHHQRFHIRQLLLAHIDLVFAATTTAQRHLIVDVCQDLGAIVTVIGTGVYYTPAIRRANVGVAKADSTYTSVSCADMVLLDSNFVSLVNAIDMSRRMYENLKKVITYCLSTNITIILVHLSFIIFKLPCHIYITVVFIIAFLVNMLPSLSLFYEKAEENLMRQKPKVYDDFIINRRIIMVAFVIVGSIEAGAVFLIYFIYMAENGFLPRTLMGLSVQWFNDANNDITDSYGQEWTSDARQYLQNEMSTISLMTIIVMQCTNLILCKTGRANVLYHGFSNILLNISVVYLLIFCFVLQFIDLRDIMHLVPIKNVKTFIFYVWPFVVVLAAFESIRRYLIRQFPGTWLELTTLY